MTTRRTARRRSGWSTFPLLVILALALGGCGSEDAAGGAADGNGGQDAEQAQDAAGEQECGELTPVTVRLNWVYNYNQVPLMTAADRGYYEDECLDVELEAGQGSGDTVTNVGSGVAEIGLADAISVMQAQAQDVPVTGVGVLWRQNAFAVIIRDAALEERGIDEPTPQDLHGMRLGAVTTGSPYTFWQAFVAQQDIDEAQIDEVSLSPPGFAEMVQGSVDFLANFTGSRFALERQDVSVSMMRGSDFGQIGYGLALLANDDWLEDNGDAVTRFLTATARGMMYSGENPDAAIDHVAAFNPDVGLDEAAREQERLPHLDSVELWADGGMENPESFLSFTAEGLEGTQRLLYDAGVLEGEPFDVNALWTDEYLPEPEAYIDG